MTETAANIFRDYKAAGVPSSGEYQPEKALLRRWGAWVEAGLNAGTLNGPWKASLAALNADLAHDADTVGFVYTTSDIGTYVKSGASGAGSWTKILDYVPGMQIAAADDDGSSTANAWTMDTAPQASASDGVTLITGFFPVTNTSATVTVAFDGGTALAVKTQAGNDPAIGGCVAGSPFIGKITGSGTQFRLLSDQASSAIQAAAEAAQAAAEAAAAGVSLPSIQSGDAGKQLYVKGDETGYELLDPQVVTVADRAALLALGAGTTAYLKEAGREGIFVWDGSDLSGTLLGADISSSAVNDTTDTITSTGHGLRTGDPVITTTAVNGLSLNTIYYAIRTDDDNFQLASSFADAMAGTDFDLTGTTAVTVKRHYDAAQGIYVTPTATLSGASGAWVRQRFDYLIPEQFGATPDDNTGSVPANNRAALQAMFNMQRDLGYAIGFTPSATYYVSGTLAHQRVVDTGPEDWIIHGNRAKLSWQGSGVTSGYLFTLGATGTTGFMDHGGIDMPTHLFIEGPETDNPVSNAADTTTVGVRLYYCGRLEGRFQVDRCFQGIETQFAFPLKMHGFTAQRCWTGAKITDDSTLATWYDAEFVEADYGVVIVCTSTSGSIQNQKFIGPRFEDVKVPIHLDPLSGSGVGITDVEIIAPRFESITYDFIRAGVEWTYATPGTRGGNQSRNIFNVSVSGGLWSDGSWSSTKAALCFDSAITCKGWDIAIPVDLADSNAMVNRPARSSIRSIMAPLGSATRAFDAPVGEGLVVFNGTDASIYHKQGNISGVARNNTGDYTITFLDNYEGANYYAVDGSADNAWVDSNGAAAGTCGVKVRTDAGSLVDRSVVRVSVKGLLG